MPRLTIHLKEKFANDTVVIRANGTEVLREERVATKLLLGYALVREVELPDGSHTLEVEVTTKKVSGTITVVIPKDRHLEVWLLDRVLDLRIPEGPPAYL